MVFRFMSIRIQGRLFSGLVAIVIGFSAQAGGLYIGEFGQPNQGASRAGANAIAEDASTAFQNPAGTMFLGESKSMATAIVIDSKSKFDQSETFPATASAVTNAAGDGPASNGGDAGSTALGGAYFYANPINDTWGWSFAFASISGASLEYENGADFAGRYWATKVDLLTISAAPSISYKVSENLSIAATLGLTFGQLDLDVAIPGPVDPNGVLPYVKDGLAEISDGDDLALSVGVSTMWQATDETRLGLIYNSEIELDFDSDLNITPPGGGIGPGQIGANVEITWPQTLRGSVAHDYSDQLTLLASVAWEDWSAFKDVPITTSTGGGSALPRNYRDTWHFAVGLRWQEGPRWTYYTGIAYDTDPTKASDRTADMPLDEQWRYSAGATYERDNGHKIGGVLTYADYGDADIDNGGVRPGPGGETWTVKGDYSTNRIIMLGLNYGW
ncbi:MAG: outer membrane protein transport protein [Gammaproteobacteria bacterium]|nr:outer membrane protein transport protein [Gammaproteobacteria bacterium]